LLAVDTALSTTRSVRDLARSFIAQENTPL
jgi:hypothetical protein